jgi:hypothetical protein
MTEHTRYRAPLKHRLIHVARVPLKLLLKIAVPLFAIRGKYPPLMLTPDDPVSPFGSGTTKGSSVEPSQMAVYRRFGRYVGDVVWLAWRNGGYGVAYHLKPGWLKRLGVRYIDLEIIDHRDGDEGTIWLRQPDGTWLWETTRKYGLLYVISGYRLRPIMDAFNEESERVRKGESVIGRPLNHPNMDGRRIFTFRSKRTL